MVAARPARRSMPASGGISSSTPLAGGLEVGGAGSAALVTGLAGVTQRAMVLNISATLMGLAM